MTDSAQNKAVSQRWIEVFNMRDDQAEAEVRAPEFVAHAPASLEPRPLTSEPWAGFLAGFVEGFPDVLITVEGAVGDGDLVAQRLRFEGTHKGVSQGLPPTGRRVTFSGLRPQPARRGRSSPGAQVQLDALSLLQQLGLVVVPGLRLVPRILADLARRPFRRR